jgi:hypothetical protein
LAALFLADYLSSVWVFGYSEKDAKAETEILMHRILNTSALVTKESTRLAPRAIGEIGDWLTINQRKVLRIEDLGREEDGQVMSYEVLGYQDDYYYYLVPSALRDFLEKNNFSALAVQEQLAKMGIIEVSSEAGKRQRTRFSKPKKINGELYRLIFIRKSALSGETDSTPPEEDLELYGTDIF